MPQPALLPFLPLLLTNITQIEPHLNRNQTWTKAYLELGNAIKNKLLNFLSSFCPCEKTFATETHLFDSTMSGTKGTLDLQEFRHVSATGLEDIVAVELLWKLSL